VHLRARWTSATALFEECPKASRHNSASVATPAKQLLDLLGPVEHFHGDHDLGDFGMPARAMTEDFENAG